MKKIMLFVSVLMCLFAVAASAVIAEEAQECDVVKLSIDVKQYRVLKFSGCCISIDLNGQTYSKPFNVTNGTEHIDLEYTVDKYMPGDKMNIRVDYGARGLKYYDTYALPGQNLTASTYMQDGVHNNTICLLLDPLYYKDVDMFFNYKELTFTKPAFLWNDEYAFVPVIELAKAIGIDDAAYIPENNQVRIAFDNLELIYNVGSDIISVNGKEYNAHCKTDFVGWTIFADLSPLAETFRSDVEMTDEGEKYNINLSTPAVVSEYIARTKQNNKETREDYVNSQDWSSQTDYLIWVSKSEYKVRVYLGSQGKWSYVKTISCAIGAPSSPTCEGVYTYYEKISRWTYENFYCGPVMRFNHGYAIHSTLIKYNGEPYDSRVGMQISHGCVRVPPDEMNWLVSYVPLDTTICVTP